MKARRTFTATGAAIAIAGLVISLAGCTAPLTTKDVSVSLQTSNTHDLLSGDNLHLAASGALKDKRNDRVAVLVQSSPDGHTWSTVRRTSTKGPKFAVADDVTLKTAGTYHYRALVKSAGKTLATTKESVASVLDIQQLVRDFYYNASHAYDQGTAAGLANVAATAYPGIFDQSSPSWTKAMSDLTKAGFTETQVPELDTVSPAPTWLLSRTGCSATQLKPSPGRTFIVTVDATITNANGYTDSSKADVHNTFLGGKLYAYPGFCG